jgi:hypothetical protein
MNSLELILKRFKQKNESLNENDKFYLFKNLNKIIKNKSLLNLINQFDQSRLAKVFASLKEILLDLDTHLIIKVSNYFLY